MSPESPANQEPRKRHLSIVPPLESSIPTKPRADGGNPLVMTPAEQQAAYQSRDPSEWDTTTPMPIARRMSEVLADPNAVPDVIMTEEEFRADGATSHTVTNHPDNLNTKE